MALKNTHHGATAIRAMLRPESQIHFIGIGGVSMSSLAQMTMQAGYTVSGSDRTETKITRKLEEMGIRVCKTHAAENVDGASMVVYTVAIAEDNPEYLRAKELCIPLVSRSDYLGYLMCRYRRRIGVAGMHGKSTVTSMLADVFLKAQTAPTVLAGAEMPCVNSCYLPGEEKEFIFEACEYMDSFLDFYPTVAVVLNVELDHTDYFADLDAVKRSFRKWLSLTGSQGVAVLNGDDAVVREIAGDYAGKRVYFSVEGNDADVVAKNIRFTGKGDAFDLYYQGQCLGLVSLQVFGKHNVADALACAAVALTAGMPFEAVKAGLATFKGAGRRMQLRGSLQDKAVRVYDDYAHHPTEIAASLQAARTICENKVVCVFQSHTYSRTAELFGGFCQALRLCDKAIITDIYAARETDTRGVSGARLAEAIGHGARYARDFAEAAEIAYSETSDGDILIIMGAGDVFKVISHLPLKE